MGDKAAVKHRPKFLGLFAVSVLVGLPALANGDLGVPTASICGTGGGTVAADGLHCHGGRFDGKTILL
jgi:hypothetical protein